jgi:hypothetical protein
VSYSRWLGSYWYTFWSSSDAEKREDEIFEICAVQRFSYQEIKKNINKCIKLTKKECEHYEIKPTKDDLLELKVYMGRFIKDVDNEYDSKPDEIINKKLEEICK